MASGTIKMEAVEWLKVIAKDIALHINNSSDVLVLGASHHIAISLHTNASGVIAEDDLITPTTALTITKSNNTVNFVSADNIVLNVICRKGTAYFV